MRPLRALFYAVLGTIACTPTDSTGAVHLVGTIVPRELPALSQQQEVIDSLLMVGDSVYYESATGAAQVWHVALEQSRATADSARIARALTGLGQAARMVSDYANARLLGEQALALKLQLGMQEELFRSYNALGLVAWDEQRLADASGLFDQAAHWAVETRDSASLAKAVVNMGLVSIDRGAFDSARVQLERGRGLAVAHSDPKTAVRALNNLAMLDIKLGNASRAVETLQQVRVLAPAAGDSVTEVNAMGQLALAYHELGDPQRAFALLDSALEKARRNGWRQEEVANISLMADLFGDAGDHQHALEYYRRALSAIDTAHMPDERGNILRNMARSHAALGNHALAWQQVSSARDNHQKAGMPYSEFGDLLLIARLSTQAGKSDGARTALAAAHGIARELDVPAAHSMLAITTAEVSLDAGQPQRALMTLQGARKWMEVVGAGARAEALHLEARAHVALGDTVAGIDAGRRALELVERVRGAYSSGELRTSFASDKSALFESHALLLFRARRAEDAFAVADAARGRALMDHIAAAGGESDSSGDVALLVQQDQLLRRIDELSSMQSSETQVGGVRATASPLSSELQVRLRAAQREYALVAARTGANRRLPLASPSRSASLEQVQSSLEPGEVLLEYFVTTDRLLIFAVRRNDFTTFEVAESSDKLLNRVQTARRLVEQRGREEAVRPVLDSLYATLIAPVARAGVLQSATRIIIVPHGALAYLPFPALRNRSRQRYLVEEFALLRLPTSASLPVLRSSVGTVSSARGHLRAEVFAPLPDSLPGTRQEATRIAATRDGVRTYVGRRATEAALRESLARPALVHVASHASMNSRNPLFSHVRLATPKRITGANARELHDNGRIDVHELLALRIASPLVFLSGCETGLGQSWSTRSDTGEDYTTVAQAFLFAGARNVVATLWRVDDVGASEFAKHFYGALDAGDVAAALARAQRLMLADGKLKDPYYWAAYDIMGAGNLPSVSVRNSAAGIQ